MRHTPRPAAMRGVHMFRTRRPAGTFAVVGIRPCGFRDYVFCPDAQNAADVLRCNAARWATAVPFIRRGRKWVVAQ